MIYIFMEKNNIIVLMMKILFENVLYEIVEKKWTIDGFEHGFCFIHMAVK